MAPRAKKKAVEEPIQSSPEVSEASQEDSPPPQQKPAKRTKRADGKAAAVNNTAATSAKSSKAKQPTRPATNHDGTNGAGEGDGSKAKAPPRGKGRGKGKVADGGTEAAVEEKQEGAGEQQGGSGGKRYYLMKSEPEEFSLDDLAAKPDQTGHWEGVRNAQARNIMRGMALGDEAFFYHSSCKVPAIVGVVRVVREAYPDHFAFNKDSKYYDERSTPEAPKWWMVDVQLVRRTARPVTLAELRAEGERGEPIRSMTLINKSRLSVQPVTEAQWQRILELEQEPAPEKK